MGYTKLIRSGDILEVYRYEKNLPIRRRIRKQDTYQKRRNKITTRSPDSVRRAKKSFFRIVRSNLIPDQPPALLTLTMSQNLPYAASSRIFTRFAAKLSRYHKGIRYIAVPEFQKRGAVHWHIILWGLNEKIQTESETRYISRIWLRGFVDGLITDGSPKLAGYLAKYMSKAMQDIRLGGKKAYYSSHNILRPMSVSSGNESIQNFYQEHLMPGVDNLLTEREFDTEWLGRCHYQQFKAQ